MAVIRLEFDIDSDVHPELHAMLSAIASLAARGERLRQLAATGLVWERTRIEGLPMPAQTAPRQAARALVTAPVASAAPRATPKRPPPGLAARSSFVDLAIDAVRGVSAPPADPLALREFEDEVERVVRELPELFDVLEPGEYVVPAPAAVGRKPAAVPPPAAAKPKAAAVPVLAETEALLPVLADMAPAVPVAPVPAEAAREPSAPGPDSIFGAELRPAASAPAETKAPVALPAEADLVADLQPLLPMPVEAAPGAVPASESVGAVVTDAEALDAETPPPPPKRTRLMRMKDKGLFKNE